MIAGFLIIVMIVAPYRLHSQATGEKLDRTQEGVPLMITIPLAGLVLFLGVLVFMIDPRSMGSSALPLPGWARWAGVGMTAITVE